MKKYITFTTLIAMGALCANAESSPISVAYWDFTGSNLSSYNGAFQDGYQNKLSDVKTATISGNGGSAMAQGLVFGENTENSYLNLGQIAGELGLTGTNKTISITVEKSSSYKADTTSSNIRSTFLGYSPSNGVGNGKDIRFGIKDDGKLRSEFSGGGLETSNSVDWTSGEQTVFTLVMENTSVTLYKGETQVFSGSQSNISTASEASSGGKLDVYIGYSGNTGGYLHGVTVKNFAVFSSALSQDQVKSVVTKGIVIPEPSMFGILAGMGALALTVSRRRRK